MEGSQTAVTLCKLSQTQSKKCNFAVVCWDWQMAQLVQCQPPHRLMSKFFHGQVIILYKSNDDVAFLTTYSFAQNQYCIYLKSLRPCCVKPFRANSTQLPSYQPCEFLVSVLTTSPLQFRADALRNLLCGAACGPYLLTYSMVQSPSWEASWNCG